MSGTALSKTMGVGMTPMTQESWAILKEQAEMLVTTGFLPAAIKSANQAVAIILKGRELGIPAMYALSNIVVIGGKPAANAELMLALIYRDHGDDAVVFTETTPKVATVSYKRRGWKDRRLFSFTIEDATRAGLTAGNWKTYPAAMLRARCISAVARLAFPDTIGGMYTPEELGASVHGETGEVIALPPEEPAAPTNSAAPVVEVQRVAAETESGTPPPAIATPESRAAPYVQAVQASQGVTTGEGKAKRYDPAKLAKRCAELHEDAIALGLDPDDPPGEDAEVPALLAYGTALKDAIQQAQAELEAHYAAQGQNEMASEAPADGAPLWPGEAEPAGAAAAAPRRAGA